MEYYIDSSNEIFRYDHTGYHRAERYTGVVATYQTDPMIYPVRQITADQYAEFIYRGTKPI